MAGLQWLTYDVFAPRVGEAFDVAEPAELRVELIDATESAVLGGAGPEGQQRNQFSLFFRGPSTQVLPQGTYALTHEELGEVMLFLVPVGPDQDGMVYEAAFA